VKAGNFSAERTRRFGLPLIASRVFGDDRGFFYESWRDDSLRALGIEADFVQDNHSFSRRGVLRGLHWQGEPFVQAKLVRCTRGRIRDVVVDIRAGSPTFGESESVLLEAAEPGAGILRMLFVPPGFAHGFLALCDEVDVQYKVTAPWNAAAEGCIAWDDPELAVDWEFPGPFVVSAKDRAGMSFAQYRANPAFRWEGKP
jgi:dTDP-4-dehydrorhamnose 3,5-epimerase